MEATTQYLKPEVIQRIARLDLQARCIAEGFLSGLHRSALHGFSTEFSEHRKYTPGDSIRFIDWQVYGRTDRLYVRKYEAQTNLECSLLVDISKSMGYRHESSSVSKLEYAIYLAAAMSYLMVNQQDSVGLATFDNMLRTYIRPNAKPRQLSTIIGNLAATRPSETTEFKTCFPRIASLLRHKGLVVLFSDFLGDIDDLVHGLHRLRHKGHDVIVFHILDPAELDLPFTRSSRFIDTEDSSSQVQAEADQIRAAYREEINAFTDRVKDECTKQRVQYLLLNTAQPFDVALQHFLIERNNTL
jgi:uncharacterized protein (DUF58 family)